MQLPRAVLALVRGSLATAAIGCAAPEVAVPVPAPVPVGASPPAAVIDAPDPVVYAADDEGRRLDAVEARAAADAERRDRRIAVSSRSRAGGRSSGSAAPPGDEPANDVPSIDALLALCGRG